MLGCEEGFVPCVQLHCGWVLPTVLLVVLLLVDDHVLPPPVHHAHVAVARVVERLGVAALVELRLVAATTAPTKHAQILQDLLAVERSLDHSVDIFTKLDVNSCVSFMDQKSSVVCVTL
jgi:hypothetical protein